MMKRLSAFVFCAILVACQSGTDSSKTIDAEKSDPIDMKSEISKLKYTAYSLDFKAKKDLLSWTKFTELDGEILELKAGDISYFESDAQTLISFMKALKSSMPETIKTPAIEARLLTLETKMLKLQSILSLNGISDKEELESIRDVLVAHANLKLQINKKYEKESQNIVKP